MSKMSSDRKCKEDGMVSPNSFVTFRQKLISDKSMKKVYKD